MRLSDEDAGLFFRLMWHLQFFVNGKLGILPQVGSVEAYGRLPQADKLKVRDALWEHPGLIDEFVAADPIGLPADEVAVIQSWKHFVAGDFFVERFLKRGAVFIGTQDPPRVYLVLALYQPLEEVLPPHSLPHYVKAVLLPFRGRIVYDGLLITHSLLFGGGISGSLRETYLRAKQRGEIVESLEPPSTAAPSPAAEFPAGRRARPGPDLVPAMDEIAAAAGRLKAPGQPVQGAALAVLKAAAHLAQTAAQDPDDLPRLWDLAGDAQKALRRLSRALERAE
jgi:hypothetical protein